MPTSPCTAPSSRAGTACQPRRRSIPVVALAFPPTRGRLEEDERVDATTSRRARVGLPAARTRTIGQAGHDSWASRDPRRARSARRHPGIDPHRHARAGDRRRRHPPPSPRGSAPGGRELRPQSLTIARSDSGVEPMRSSRMNRSLERANRLFASARQQPWRRSRPPSTLGTLTPAGHSRRVQTLALLLGRDLRLSEAELEALGHAARFHDVGKLAVPEAILLKSDELGDIDWDVIRRHPEVGARPDRAPWLPG